MNLDFMSRHQLLRTLHFDYQKVRSRQLSPLVETDSKLVWRQYCAPRINACTVSVPADPTTTTTPA